VLMKELLQTIREVPNIGDRIEIDGAGILTPLIQGFIGSKSCLVKRDKWQIAIVSRLSAQRAGTRFNARGIDDDGHVSNFVESEYLIYHGTNRISFLQVRGSVPVFWEQTGVQVGAHKLKISRGPESTLHAAQKHFKYMVEKYGNIQIVNLLSQAPGSAELTLTENYKMALSNLEYVSQNITFGGFDFKAIVKRDEYDRVRLYNQSFLS
jgi:synaptojanin